MSEHPRRTEVENSSPVNTTMNLYQKLLDCRTAIGYIVKEDKKVNNQFFPVSYEGVIERVAPELKARGLVCISRCTSCDVQPRMKVRENGVATPDGYLALVAMEMDIVDSENPTQHETIQMYGHGFGTLDTCVDKATTKAQRICLQRLFMLPSYEEGNAPEEPSTPVEPARYTTISPQQVEELQLLAINIEVDEAVVAQAAGVARIDLIPVAKFGEIFERMSKRLAQKKGGAK